jgi:tetratricopeptide (TPR) repeat protein
MDMSWKGRVGALCLVGVVAGLLGWLGTRSESLEVCERAAAGDADAEALAGCRRLWEERGLPGAGALLARACKERGDEAGTRAVAVALGARAEAGAAWRLVAELAQARQDASAVREAREQALGIHRRAGLPREAFTDARALYGAYWSESRYREAIDHVQVAYEVAGAAGDGTLQGKALLALFSILYDVGDLDGAESTLRRIRQLVGREEPELWLFVRFDEGLLRKGRGQLPAARAAYRDVIELAPPGHHIGRYALLNLIEVCLALGEVDEAAAHLETVLARDSAEGFRNRVGWVAQRHAVALVARARGQY